MKKFNSKDEIMNFLHDYCVKAFIANKPESEKNVFEKFECFSVSSYLKTTESMVKVIKEAGYTLENFRNNEHFDQEWIEIYDRI